MAKPPAQERRLPTTRAKPGDVPPRVGGHLALWLVMGGVLAVLYGSAREPGWVEETFVRGFGGQIARVLSLATGILPVSIAELVVVGLVAVEVWWFGVAVAAVWQETRDWANALWGGVAHLVDVSLVLLVWFYGSWGLAYARPPVDVRMDLPVDRIDDLSPSAQRTVLQASTQLAIRRTNESYRALHGSKDAEVVTAPPRGFKLDRAIEDAYAGLAERYDLAPVVAQRHGKAKYPLGHAALSYLGIGGIYVPFTGEATVNGGPPRWSQIMTIAHEKAHQRMVTSEDEASFIGFLALVHSDEPLLRYAAWQFARRQLLRAWSRVARGSTETVAAKLDPGPQRDVVAVHLHWDGYQGWLQDAHAQVNDAYLKANNVEGGVASYSRASRLLLAWLDTPEGKRAIRGQR